MRLSKEAQVLCLLVLVPIGIDSFGRASQLMLLFPGLDLPPGFESLAGLLWWVLCTLVGFALIPLLWIRWQGLCPRDFGLRRPPLNQHLLVYPAMLAVMLPILLYFSSDARFRETYPFYREAAQHLTWAAGWEVAYGMMFIALEFFFRGFLIGALKGRYGWWAVLISTVPYFLIHHRKPLPEMLGSFPAGIILGTLAWRTGSIWGGVLVHLGVAFTMDGVQLLHLKGG